MTRHEVHVEDLEINSIDDLYTNVLIPVGYDAYDSRTLYDTVTVWYCINDINDFKKYMEGLGVDDFISFRDEMDGNVLSSLALSNKPIEFWNLVEDFVGSMNFVNMLTMRNRAGSYPITEISDLDVFAEQLSKTYVTIDMMRQIAIHGTNEIVEYLANAVNEYITNNHKAFINEFLTDIENGLYQPNEFQD